MDVLGLGLLADEYDFLPQVAAQLLSTVGIENGDAMRRAW